MFGSSRYLNSHPTLLASSYATNRTPNSYYTPQHRSVHPRTRPFTTPCTWVGLPTTLDSPPKHYDATNLTTQLRPLDTLPLRDLTLGLPVPHRPIHNPNLLAVPSPQLSPRILTITCPTNSLISYFNAPSNTPRLSDVMPSSPTCLAVFPSAQKMAPNIYSCLSTKLRTCGNSPRTISLSHLLRLLHYPRFLSSAWTPRPGPDLGQ